MMGLIEVKGGLKLKEIKIKNEAIQTFRGPRPKT